MKNKLTLLFPFALLFLLQSCWWTNDESDDIIFLPSVSLYEPVILERAVFETTTEIEDPRAINKSGKIYVKDDFLFVNEVNQGFHIFNNSDPTNPQNIAFLKVLGASDISIKNDIFYINNATDLIAVLPNFEQNSIEITKRIPNTFPQLWSPEGFEYFGLESDEIIVDWILIE